MHYKKSSKKKAWFISVHFEAKTYFIISAIAAHLLYFRHYATYRVKRSFSKTISEKHFSQILVLEVFCKGNKSRVFGVTSLVLLILWKWWVFLKTVGNNSFHFYFWVIPRFFSYVGNCKNIFPLKVYSISTEFTCSFLNLNIAEERSKKNFTFSNKCFENCAQKIVWYFFETLSAATRFNPEPMNFLIGVIFRKNCYLVVENWETSDTSVVHSKNFIVLSFPNCVLNTVLFRRSGKWNFYSINCLRFEQKFGLICQKTCFFSFVWFWGVFEAYSKNIAVKSLKMPAGYRDKSLLSFLNLFIQGSSLKVVQKVQKMFQEMKNLFLHYLGHS